MSDGDYRNRPSLHIPGKEFLIVIVVVFSSLSFTLGYLVGKSKRDDAPVPAVRAVETPSPRSGADTSGVQPEAEAGSGTDYPLSAGVVKPSPSKGKLQKGTISYTVQIGALSDEKDAEDFRTRYRKKGYKAYIVSAKDKRGETIYKIRIGEFRNRRDADLLSLKLRKTEGLNTFVTFKDE
ncbi:MAG: SPOR domain-containing protein [Candidatus Sulfobium sp.]|jgi:cell division septation protein DedD